MHFRGRRGDPAGWCGARVLRRGRMLAGGARRERLVAREGIWSADCVWDEPGRGRE